MVNLLILIHHHYHRRLYPWTWSQLWSTRSSKRFDKIIWQAANHTSTP